MTLEVTDGQNTASGVIPVTDALPEEFLNACKPSNRNQLARIGLEPDGTRFPLPPKVRAIAGLNAEAFLTIVATT